MSFKFLKVYAICCAICQTKICNFDNLTYHEFVITIVVSLKLREETLPCNSLRDKIWFLYDE